MPQDPQSPNLFDDYNTMQQTAGIIPPFASIAPPTPFPGQVSAAFAQSMGFPSAMTPWIGGSQYLQGPGGGYLPMMGGAPANPFGQGAMPGMMGGGLYTPAPMRPPPAYAGLQGGSMMPLPLPPPPPQFDTPYQAQLAQNRAGTEKGYGAMMSGFGIGARVGTDLAAGAAGMAFGGPVGGLLGVAGAEMFGLSRGVQNFSMNHVMGPSMNRRATALGIQNMSRGFVAGGSDLDDSGSGFSFGGSMRVARGLENMAGSESFQRETFGRFNRQDVHKITQLAGQSGLMAGAQNPDQMVSKVRDVAKSLQAFMELAGEPDVQKALTTMGNLQTSGLNLQQTTNAVANARVFARQAGTSFEQLAQVGGAMGSQTYASLGLSQGVGFQAGMGNFAQATASQNRGTIGAMGMGLVGGAQGLAALNTSFSAGFLQTPMVAPSLMSSRGGMNVNSVQQLLTGRTDMMSMTGAASNNLTGMTGRMGVEGLGMAVAMQPMIQSQLGQIMESQGPFARRNVEDQQILALSRRMGMRGSAGFMTMAQTMGMGQSQAMARAAELSSPGYFDDQHRQIEVRRREQRATEIRDQEAQAPGFNDRLASASGAYAGIRSSLRSASFDIESSFNRAMGQGVQTYGPTTDTGRRAQNRMLMSSQFGQALDRMGRASERSGVDASWGERYAQDRLIDERAGASGWMSAVTGLAPRGSRERQAWINNMQLSGRASETILNTTPRQALAAQQQASPFANTRDPEAARSQFVNSMIDITRNGDGNVFGGRAGDMVGNIMTGGAVQQRGANFNQQRDAYVNAMVQGGMSPEAARQSADSGGLDLALRRDASTIRMSSGAQGRENLRGAADRGQRARPTAGNFTQNARDMAREGMESIFGHSQSASSDRLRSAFNSLVENQGDEVGSTAALRGRSRTHMATLAMLQATLNNPSTSEDQRRVAQSQFTSTQAELHRQGYSDPEIQAMQDRVENQNSRGALATPEVRQLGADLVQNNQTRSSRDVLDTVNKQHEKVQVGEGAVAFSMGVERLGRRNDAMGRAFHGITRDNFTQERYESAVRNISNADLEEIAQTDPEQAAQLRRAKGGDTEAFKGLRARRVREGQAPLTASNRYQSSTPWSRLFTSGQSVFDTEEDFINRETAEGTAADGAAARAHAGVDATQSAAGRTGVGGSGDQMVVAAREMREAARLLSDAVGNHGIEGLMPTGTP